MSLMNNVAASRNPSASMTDQLRGKQLNQEDFMTLLLAQLRLQSPTSPFDSSTMMEQISQLTSLSASQELEKTIKSLSTNMGTSQVLEASRLVGKQVQTLNDKCVLVPGEGLKGATIVPNGIESVAVTIRDTHDKIVKTMNLRALTDGVADFAWDGLDSEGKPMAPGNYKVTANGTAINGDSVALPVAGTFKVSSVGLDKNGKGVVLNVDGLGAVEMRDIIKIM